MCEIYPPCDINKYKIMQVVVEYWSFRWILTDAQCVCIHSVVTGILHNIHFAINTGVDLVLEAC